MASVCKPRPSASSSVVSSESVTSTISATAPTTTVEAESTTATSADLSTTLTSTVDDNTTESTNEVETFTSGMPSSSTTATANTTEISTTVGAMAAQSTTTPDATTTVSAPEPFSTFDVLAIGGGSIDGQYMRGVANEGSLMGWDITDSGIGYMLKCSVPGVQCVFEPDTVCTPTGRGFDQFYTYSGRSDGLWLPIDSSSNPPTDSSFQTIELGITSNQPN